MTLKKLSQRQRWIAWALFSTSLMGSGITHAEEGQQVRKSYTVLVWRDFAPLSYRDESGHLLGFNVELAQLLCTKIQASCNIQDVNATEVIPSLKQEKADFATASLIVTPEREKEVLFTRPYRSSKSFWISNIPMSRSDGLKVGVFDGSLQKQWAESGVAKQQGWKLVALVSSNRLMKEALLSKQVDAFIAPSSAAYELISNRKTSGVSLSAMPIDDDTLDRPVAVAVAPRKDALRQQLDAALREAKSNGELDRINSKYYLFRIF